MVFDVDGHLGAVERWELGLLGLALHLAQPSADPRSTAFWGSRGMVAAC